MAEAITMRPASRGNAKPLVGFYSESNGGKTYNALLLARGFVGKEGRIAMIETEAGRGEAYSSPAEYPEFAGTNQESNYDVIPLRDDFSPERYSAAITLAEQAKVDALIVDSGSHEWEGIGGVLDMAAERQKTMKGALVWQKPKIDHQKHFMLRLMQTPIPLVILCMRAKYPMQEVEVVKNGQKKKEWQRSEKLEPKQSEDVLFEMMVHGWFDQKTHVFNPTKLTGRGLPEIFPQGQLITLETGKRFAEWASGRGVPQPKQQTDAPHPLNDEQKENARSIARKGTSALQKWWGDLREIPGEQLRYSAFLPELKEIASEVTPPPEENQQH